MKRKSIGKLAIVALLSVAILLSFTVCSKKAETKTTTTTTATSAPATTAPATTPAATAPVQEEKKAEVPAAEPTPAPVVEPVVEEPAPVVETVAEEPAPVEEPAVEEVKEDLPVYSTLVSSNGITVAFVAYNDHATATIPSGIDADKIKSAADYVLSVYPAAASLPYTFDGNVLEISYPAQSDDVIVGIVSSLADAVTKAIDSYYAAEVEVAKSKEFSVAADGTINATYSYKGLAEADVVLADGVATIKYPAHYIYRSDIDEFVAAAVAKYPALAQYVTYSVPEDGTLVVTYPASLKTSHLVEALAVLNDQVTVYIDNFITSYLKAFEPAEEAPAVVEEAPAIEVPAFSTLITTHGLTATVEAYADKAYITVPAGTTKGDVDAVVGLLAKAYPELASAVVYSFDGSVVTLQYPAQSDAVIRAAVSELNTLAVAAADQFFGKEEAKAEVVVEEAPAVVEEVPAFSTLITTHGLTATVEAYADKAYITVPAGTTKGDVDAVVGLLAKAYPELASAVVYSFDGSVVTLQYPAQSDAVIRAAVSELNTLAVAAADQFFGKVEAKAEVVVEEAPAVVEEAPAIEVPAFSTLITTHGLTATVEAYADKAYITVPAGTTKGDVDAVVGLLAKAYPELASAVVYSFDGSVVTLQYPAQSDAVIRAAVSELNTLAVAAADQFFGKEEAKAEVVVEEAPAVVEEVPVAEAPKSETEAPVAPVTPVAEIKPVDTIKKFEVGVAARPALNFTYESPFFADIEARFAVNVTPTIALGAKVGFGLDGYIPLKAYGEYNFTENLYAFAEAGAEFGIAANQGKTVPVIGLGVGYEKAITDNISIFGEAGVEFKIGYEKPVVPGLTIGAKMAF